MPLVKIDYVVSFSSEDPEHPASNLLSSDVKSKWLCSAGESSCSIVLQLKSACKIESITIGAYHVALIEVLVGLSEKPNDPFEVLVPSSVLLSPGASRRGEGAECVRAFGAAQLARAAERRWDRVRLVCSQPYNKHCKYGLAFVHISSSEGPTPAPAPAAAPPAAAHLRALLLDAEASSSDEEFRPGELFARHRARLSGTTDAQIRQATSQALNNIPDTSTKLTKTPITKTSHKEQTYTSETRSDRRKESLMYTDDDDKPHAKIDRVVQRHNENKKHDKTAPDETDGTSHKHRQNTDKISNNQNNDLKEGKNKVNTSNVSRSVSDTFNSSKVDKTPMKKDSERNAENASASQKKRKRSATTHPELGPVCSQLGEVLAGAAVAMSGYANPRRADLRTAALELGARYLRDWEPACTHLVCAFPNTPKLRSVRAAKAATVAVTGEWLEQCRRTRRRLPWRWFATDPQQREPAPRDLDSLAPGDDQSEGDTDDEIEKVLKQQEKKQRRDSSPDTNAEPSRDQTDASDHRDTTHATSHHTDPERHGHTVRNNRHGHTDTRSTPGHTDDTDNAHSRNSSTDADETIAMDVDVSRESDVAFVRDERVQAEISLNSDSDATDEDERIEHPDSAEIKKELPSFWEGSTFVVSRALGEQDAARLTRYIRAYGGLVLKECDVLEDSSVQYVVEADAGEGDASVAGARRVNPEWVWRQHARRGLPSLA